MQFSPSDKITIIGKSGCGKSTLCQKLHESGFWRRVVVFDRMGEYDADDFSDVVSGFDHFADVIRRRHGDADFRILFRFKLESDSKDTEFNEALRVLFYLSNVLVVVEETWNFSTKNYLPKWYKEILLTGRHKNVSLISTSQRPAEVHKTVFSQSAHVFCGLMFETNDIKYLASIFGRENADRLRDLAVGKFLHLYQGQVVGIVDSKK